MPELKPIARAAIGRALSRAERYRLLNEPREAESICRDVLAVDPENQEALVTLILALTDLFAGFAIKLDEVRPLLERLPGRFDRLYYGGVAEERWAKALLHAGYQQEVVYHHVRLAMDAFEEAESLAPEGNDDAILRYNACIRLIERNGLKPPAAAAVEPGFEAFDDDVPMR